MNTRGEGAIAVDDALASRWGVQPPIIPAPATHDVRVSAVTLHGRLSD